MKWVLLYFIQGFTLFVISSFFLHIEQFTTKCRDPNIINCYQNPLRYNFRTVNAINVLFSTLHTTPFRYGKILLGVSCTCSVPVLQRPIPHRV